MNLLISEIFSSLQGESKFAGYPTTFVRTYGCNMLCTFCDSMYAVNGKKYKKMSLDEILAAVRTMNNKHVCLTGGEPMMHDNIVPLIYELTERQYTVTIETNGGIDLKDYDRYRTFMFIMDIKTPSSAMSDKNIYSNLALMQPRDEVKFVISNREDYEWSLDILAKYPTRAPVIFSPCFTPDNRSTIMLDLSTWIIEGKPKNVRLGLQIHKFIGLA